MPSKVPRVTGSEAVRAFRKAGFTLDRVKGSHHILRCPGKPLLSIPVHGNRTLGVGLMVSFIKDAGLTVEEFCALL